MQRVTFLLMAFGLLVMQLLLAATSPLVAQTLSPAAMRGSVFVRVHCAQCHAIGKVGASPLSEAPAFRTLHLRYPVESLQESLTEGIVTGHPSMPEFRLDPGQASDVIDYLKSLGN